MICFYQIRVIMEKQNKNLQLIAITAAACLFYGVNAGVRANYGIMLNAVSQNSGVPYAGVSFIIAIAQLMYGIMQPIAGVIALRRSNAFVLCIGAVVLGTGLLLTPFCHSYFPLMCALGVIIGSGTGILCFGVIMGAVTPVLGEEKAAIASGFISASAGLGATIMAPLINALVSIGGLGFMMRILCVPVFVLVPVSLWLGRKGRDTAQKKETDGAPPVPLLELLKAALRNRSYVFLIIGFFTCGFHMAIIETHLFSQYTSFGIPEAVVASAFSFYGILTMLGSICSGTLITRFPMQNVLGTIYGSRTLIDAALLLLPGSRFSMFLTAGLLGLTGASTVPPTSGLTGRLYGSKNLATLFGIVFLSHQLGSFLSSWIGGLLVTATGSYAPIWCADIVLAAIAATVSYMVRTEKNT